MGTFQQISANATGIYSPIMLSNEWPKIGRLLFVVNCCMVGAIMNGFFVASFFVKPALNKIGYVFLACTGMSDFIVSMASLPPAVVLLSGQGDSKAICQFLEILVQGGTYSYSLFFAMASLESYYRLCKATSDYESFISMRIGLVAMMLFTISFLTSVAGVYLQLDYDYCRRCHTGNIYFRITTTVIFFVIPFIVTAFCLLSNSCRIRDKARKHNHYKRSQQYEQDATLNNLNITAYILFAAGWLPYVTIVYFYPDTSDAKYYQCAWIGVTRSVVTSTMYGFIERNFRRAFAYLFNYCCCKSTLSGSFASRHRRALEYKCATGDVRVHIMHQAVNTNSPQRGASSSRETQELRSDIVV